MGISVDEDRPTPAAAVSAPPRQRQMVLDEPFSDCRRVQVSTWATSLDISAAQFRGCASLSLGAGPFRLTLSPTVAQLRALADMLNATADDQQMINHGFKPGEPLDELAHAVGRMVQGGAA